MLASPVTESMGLAWERCQFGLQKDAAADGVHRPGGPFALILADSLCLVPHHLSIHCARNSWHEDSNYAGSTSRAITSALRLGNVLLFKDAYRAPTWWQVGRERVFLLATKKGFNFFDLSSVSFSFSEGASTFLICLQFLSASDIMCLSVVMIGARMWRSWKRRTWCSLPCSLGMWRDRCLFTNGWRASRRSLTVNDWNVWVT